MSDMVRSEKRPGPAGPMSRRAFMRTVGIGVGAGGAAAVIAGPAAALSPADEAGAETGGYRETAHIRTYYEFSRF